MIATSSQSRVLGAMRRPSPWIETSLGDASICFSGGTPATSIPQYYGGDIPWITSGDLNASRIRSVEGCITSLGLEHSSAKMVRAGTLLLAMYGATAGVPAITEIDAAINQAVLAIEPIGVVTEYLFQYLMFAKERYLATYRQGGQPNLSGEIIKSFLIRLPPTAKEQEAIAGALSDADAWIESLEQLIAKKRTIMQGAMQELLTGSRRLLAFAGASGKPSEIGVIPDDWDVVSLGSIAKIKTGGRNNQDKIEDGSYPFFVRSPQVERINTYSCDCEAILIPGEGNIGNIFHYISGRFDVHQRVYAITQIDAEHSGKYLYYYLRERFGAHALKNTVKATVDSLRLPTFQEFLLATPRTKAEEDAIASVLSDMDTEVDALAAKLAKARDIKQGMMQDLLTGRVRLV